MGDNPTKAEFVEKLNANASSYPELRKEHWKKFNTLCLDTRNKCRAEALIADLGKTRFRIPKVGLRTKLEERGWNNVKTLDLATLMYERQVSLSQRLPKHPAVSTKADPKAGPSVTDGRKPAPLNAATIRGLERQEWPLILISNSDKKGRGVFAKKAIKAGTVVCDYHGRLLPYSKGHAKYMSQDTDKNVYMFYFEYGGNRYYVDANDPHCECHPHTTLKGRLINHSSSFNIKPKVYDFKGGPVLLFEAVRDVAPFEELLFDYGVAKDSKSSKQSWM